MKIKALSLIFAGAIASSIFIQPMQAAESQMSPEFQAQMAKAKEFGTPGAEHAVLNPLEGEWTTTSMSWMKPADKPMKSVGTSSMKWTLDGHFLKQKFSADFMGQKYEALGFIGYDKMKKEYTSIWLDNMSTSMFEAKGSYNEKTKTIEDTGTFSCPVTGEKDAPFRATWKIVNNDKLLYSMFVKDAASGKEYKSMEILYKRTK